ncbi:uncharacterized protein LOC106160945 [Lingula anatina]|uniref:Uncharacterized protein LOC106160945 n=1 Tax=Lingula anatina TaxID=7574 RepID=A0A1S3I4M1_LINAN|nr:uncharacterized protein LOC106160945 [Lingula anatina]|eukprot:XP_013393212.1 uncharacterized protein LOC106160945 [Lingula anatina]
MSDSATERPSNGIESHSISHGSQMLAEKIADHMEEINSPRSIEDMNESFNRCLSSPNPYDAVKFKNALFKAASLNDCDRLEALVELIKRKDIPITDFYREGNETPLHHAATFSNHSVMEILVTEYPDMVHEQRNKGALYAGQTALHIAVARRDLYAVKMLLSRVSLATSDQNCVSGVDDTKNTNKTKKIRNKETLLHAKVVGDEFVGTCMEAELVLAIAAWNADLQMVRELLNQGALPYKRDSKGRTVFHTLVYLASMEESKSSGVVSESTQNAKMSSHKSNIIKETLRLISSLEKTKTAHEKLGKVTDSISESLCEAGPSIEITDKIKEALRELSSVGHYTASKTKVIKENLSTLASMEQVTTPVENDNRDRIKETFQELLDKTDISDMPQVFASDPQKKRAYIQAYLLSLRDAQGLTPLTLAAKLGVHGLFEHIINLENTYKFLDDTDGVNDIYLYDVTDIDSAVRFNDRTSALERIPFDKPEEAFIFMELSPIREMVSAKWKEYRKYYFLWGFFHLLAMVAITLCCCFRPLDLEPQSVLNPNVSRSIGQAAFSHLTQMYSKPIDILRATFEISFGTSCFIILLFEVIHETIIHKHFPFINRILGNGTYRLTYIAFTFSAVLTFLFRLFVYHYEEIPMVAMLVSGWYFTLFFTRGFKKFSFFTVMIQKVFFGDLFRFSVVFIVLLSAFSSAMFVSFQNVPEKIPEEFADYLSTIFTLFKLALGLADIEVLSQTRRPWLTIVLFLLFVVLAYILLVNMLIALLSETCSVVAKNKTAQWKLQRLSITLLIERRLPKRLRKSCGTEKYLKVFRNPPGDGQMDDLVHQSAALAMSFLRIPAMQKRIFQRVKAAPSLSSNSYVTTLNRITTDWLNRIHATNFTSRETNNMNKKTTARKHVKANGVLKKAINQVLPSYGNVSTSSPTENCLKTNNLTVSVNPTAMAISMRDNMLSTIPKLNDSLEIASVDKNIGENLKKGQQTKQEHFQKDLHETGERRRRAKKKKSKQKDQRNETKVPASTSFKPIENVNEVGSSPQNPSENNLATINAEQERSEIENDDDQCAKEYGEEESQYHANELKQQINQKSTLTFPCETNAVPKDVKSRHKGKHLELRSQMVSTLPQVESTLPFDQSVTNTEFWLKDSQQYSENEKASLLSENNTDQSAMEN